MNALKSVKNLVSMARRRSTDGEDSRYSVMQSDGNSLCGDDVLDRFYEAPGDEDNILDQICKRKYVRIIFMMI